MKSCENAGLKTLAASLKLYYNPFKTNGIGKAFSDSFVSDRKKTVV